MRGRSALRAGAALLLLLALACLAAPGSLDPLAIDTARILEPPGPGHPLGTDGLGRDVLARLLHGGRRSLLAGAVATAVAPLVGGLLGGLAGTLPGWPDRVLSRLAEIVYAFPALVAAMAILGLARPGGGTIGGAAIGLLVGLLAWPALFRYVRAEARRLREGDRLAAARAAGAGPLRTLLLHVLPPAILPALVPAAFLAAGAILVEAGLGFLGLGIHPPHPSWGGLLREAMEHVETAWWLVLFPGAALFLVVLGCHLVGEGLRARIGGEGPGA